LVATVFGCTGLTGTYVTNLLARMGTQVVVPYRGDGQNVRDFKLMGDLGQIVPLPFDLYDRESIVRTVARSNVVINLIGVPSESRNWSFHDVHVKGASRLDKICKEAGVQRFIHVSALGAHPKSESLFLRTKYEGEEAVRDYYPDATILRPAHIFGDNDRFVVRFFKLIWRLGRRFPVIYNAQAKIQPIYVEDVARAILHSITTEGHEGNTYHLGGPEVRSWHDVIGLIQENSERYDNVLRMRNYSVPTALAIAKLYETFMFFPNIKNLYNTDFIQQMKYDIVVPTTPGTLTLEDLHIENPTKLWPQMIEIMRDMYRDPGPSKIEAFEGRDIYLS